MPVPSTINDLSTTAGSNSPAGSESPALIDDYLRAHGSFIATLRDEKVSKTGDETIAGTKTFSSNLCLGVTPSTWGGAWGVIEGGSSSNGTQSAIAFQRSAANAVNLYTNVFNNGTGEVYKYTSTAGKYSISGNTHAWYTAPSGTAGNTISFTQAMTLDASGNLLVGTTAIDGNIGSNSGGCTYTFRAADGLRVSQNGSSYWNKYSPGILLQWRNAGVDCGSISVAVNSTSYATSSDYRLKHDIAPMQNALQRVAALKPVTYKWNADGSDGEGFIAHELAEVCPQAVTGEKDAVDADGKPVYQGIDTSFLVATLTAAIQEQQVIITELRSRIEALEAK